jgi:hypothetical protein
MKKLVVVVVALVVAACAIAQTAKAPQPAKQPTAVTAAPPQSHVGKYQLFFSPHARADVYLVDTETGKIWKPITITNAKDTNLQSPPEVWVYQERVDSERDFDNWMAMHPPPAAATTPPQ